MPTVNQVMTASLKRIVVVGGNAQIDPDDAADYIFDMNNFMAMLAAKGVNLGYTVVNDVADEITIPDGAILGLVENMAVRVAPDFGATASPELVTNARESKNVMRHLGITVSETHYPSTLPRGSGNEGSGAFRVSHYYANRQAEILAEVNGPIALENDTVAA